MAMLLPVALLLAVLRPLLPRLEQPILMPGFRLLDTKDFLHGRPRFRDFHRDLLRNGFRLLDDFDRASPSTRQEMLHSAYSVAGFALFMEFKWPSRFWWNACCFAFVSPMSSFHFLVGLTVSYTDKRDVIEKNYADSSISFIAYVSTLLAFPLLDALWHFISALISFIWTNLTYTLCLCGLLYFTRNILLIPASRMSFIKSSVEWLHVQAIIRFTNVAFSVILAIRAVLGKLTWFMRLLLDLTWRTGIIVLGALGMQPRKRFSYDSSELDQLDTPSELNASDHQDHETPKIRLLRLQRKWPFRDPRVDLEVHEVGRTPPYHAISYVWSHGSQDMRRIVLNDMDHQVPGNVHDILRRCSSHFGERLIWIDSICINQKNNEEKSLQVQRMREIYKDAGQVLICLGETSGAGAAFQLLWELEFMKSTYGEAYLATHVTSFYQRRNFDEYLCVRIEALLKLLSHKWFERMWVIQELVVSQRAIIFYGNQSIPWSSFHEAITAIFIGPVVGVFTAYNLSRPTPNPGLLPFKHLGKISFLTGYRLEHQCFGQRDICYILRLFLTSKATQGIDRVFALVGVADLGNHDQTFTRLIDYNRPEEEILHDLAIHVQDTGKAVEILDLAGFGWDNVDLTLPSWVVDWRRTNFPIPLTREVAAVAEYEAAVSRAAIVSRGQNEREMVVTGLLIDTIELLASNLVYSVSGGDILEMMPNLGTLSLDEYWNEVGELARASVPDPYPHMNPTQPLPEAVWRTLIGDRTYSERPAPARYGESLRTLAHQMRSTARHFDTQGPELFFTRPSDEIQRELGMNDEEHVNVVQAANRDLQAIDFLFDSPRGQRRFAVTKNKFVGMVPSRSRVGDVVCVLYGAKIPFVLRRLKDGDGAKGQGERFHLIGESYIHGMMDGQALQKDFEEVKITLV